MIESITQLIYNTDAFWNETLLCVT